MASTPDLNPLHFYLWGHLGTLVYAVPVDNEEALHHRTADVCQTIRNYTGVFERMRRSMMRRIEACIGCHGGYFDHLLQMYCLSYNSQMKCFRAHVDIDSFWLFLYIELMPKICLRLSLTHCVVLLHIFSPKRRLNPLWNLVSYIQ
jgi:hypothetical protein